MNAKPLLAQLPMNSWATAVSTYGRLSLLFGAMGLMASGLLDRNHPVNWILVALLLSDRLFPHPEKVFINADYLEVNGRKISLDEILWVKKSRFALKVADHSGYEVSFRPYYYEQHAVARLTSLLQKHASMASSLKLKTAVHPRWWGRLSAWLLFVSATFLVLSVLGHFLLGSGAVSLDWGNIGLLSLLGCTMFFFLRAKPLLYCHSHLEIGDRKVLWNEISRVSTSLGFVCITDQWGCFYCFNPGNYEPMGMKDLRRQLEQSASANCATLPASAATAKV